MLATMKQTGLRGSKLNTSTQRCVLNPRLGKRLRYCIITLATFASFQVHAQQTPSPGGVNTCTQVVDPTVLKQCLEESAGVDNRFVPQGPPPADKRVLLKDEGSLTDRAYAPQRHLLEDRGRGDTAAGPPP